MCGICGFIYPQANKSIDAALLRKMTTVIYHRGPDDEGFYTDERAALGMRRLSIIDLVTGNQPVANEDESLWLVFNGEIYNYQSLHAELERKGHRFATRSDTEVIVHAYEEYGDRCAEKFNGMFAFALWDTHRKRLLIARDHVGIKPLYYWVGRQGLVFGSELKCLVAHPDVPTEVDLIALDQFLTLEYIPSPRTIFKAVNKLPPGHLLVYEAGEARVQQYWDVPIRDVPQDEDSAAEMLRELIDDAVRMQLMSDVPLGAFLSGGIDSSTVVASMAHSTDMAVKTFSIGFDDASYNELPYAREVARWYETDHTEEILQPEIANLAEKLVRHLDEPFGDFSIFPTYLVSQVARKKVKVVLSGDGGDELFGGYDTYVAQEMDQVYRHLPIKLRRDILPALFARIPPTPEKKGLVNKAKRFVEGASLPDALQHTRWMMFMSQADKADLYTSEVRAALNGDSSAAIMVDYFARRESFAPLSQQQYVDIKTYLVDDILTKVDRMSMAVSLEARVPLLDYRIVELAVNLPAYMKLHRGQTKRILKKAMADRLPESVLTKPKQGFSIPLKNWLRAELKPMMLDLLTQDSILRRGLFSAETVATWVDEHLKGRANHSHRLWALMVFELWHRQVLDAHRSQVEGSV